MTKYQHIIIKSKSPQQKISNKNISVYRFETPNQFYVDNVDEINSKEKIDMDSIYNPYHHNSNVSGLERTIFSYPNERSPDSTTKNVCRICGKT